MRGSGNMLTVLFGSDTDDSYRGFKAQFQSSKLLTRVSVCDVNNRHKTVKWLFVHFPMFTLRKKFFYLLIQSFQVFDVTNMFDKERRWSVERKRETETEAKRQRDLLIILLQDDFLKYLYTSHVRSVSRCHQRLWSHLHREPGFQILLMLQRIHPKQQWC